MSNGESKYPTMDNKVDHLALERMRLSKIAKNTPKDIKKLENRLYWRLQVSGVRSSDFIHPLHDECVYTDKEMDEARKKYPPKFKPHASKINKAITELDQICHEHPIPDIRELAHAALCKYYAQRYWCSESRLNENPKLFRVIAMITYVINTADGWVDSISEELRIRKKCRQFQRYCDWQLGKK